MTSTPEPEVSGRVVTLPNALSAARLVGVPAFLWCLWRGWDGLALAILIGSGLTDFVDGWLARRLGAVTRLGQVLDPLADRLYILSTLCALAVRGTVPWWFVVALLGRDVFGSVVVASVRRLGYRGLPVHFVGKAGTFNVLCAFPLLLVGEWTGVAGDWATVLGWAFAWWGLGLYWAAGLLYARQARGLWAAERAGAVA